MHKRLQTDFSAETLQTRREWDRIFKMLKEKTSSQEYSTKLFRTEENNEFSIKGRARKKFIITKLTLKEMIQYLSKLRRNNNKKTCESVNLTGKSKYILRIAD